MLILSLIFSNSASAQTANYSATTDKSQYILGEEVIINTTAPPSSTLEIISGSNTFRLFGDANGIQKFIPSAIGAYVVEVLDTNNMIVANSTFIVFNSQNDTNNTFQVSSQTPTTPKIPIIDSSSAINAQFLSTGLSLIDNGLLPSLYSSDGIRLEGKLSSIVAQDSLGRNQVQIAMNDFNQTYDADYVFQAGTVKALKIKGLKPKANSRIGMDDVSLEKINFNDKPSQVGFAINLEDSSFEVAYIERIAVGMELYKCREWNFTNQSCGGNWTKIMDLIPGVAYNITLIPGDPGYVETFDSNAARDISVTALDSNTVVIGWIDAVSNYSAFKIMNTNGSTVLNRVDVDTDGSSLSRVSVEAINSSQFVFAINDGPSTTIAFWIYDENGNIIVSKTSVDSNAGTTNDLDVCALGDRWVLGYEDQNNNPAYFYMYYNNGSLVTGPVTVETRVNPTQFTRNLLSCSQINSSMWVYGYVNTRLGDILSGVYSYSGTAIVSPTALDPNVGAYSEVAATGLEGGRFAVIYYNTSNSRLYMTVRQVSGAAYTTTLGNTLLSSGLNNQTRVAISQVRYSNRSYYVAAWTNTADSTIKAGVYNSTGGTVTSIFNVTTYANLNYSLLDVVGSSTTQNSGLCNGTFAIVYTNRTNTSVFETYWYNGSRWNGICPDTTPPSVALNEPANNTPYISSTVQFNFTVTDDRSAVIPNCTLYTNISGSWAKNNTITNINNATKANITLLGISDGTYLWNFQCFDNLSNNAFAPGNYTVLVNVFGPNISNARLNTSMVNQSLPVRFNASLIDIFGVSTALITVRYPNGTSFNYTLQNTGSEYYYIINNTTQLGMHNITLIWSNDTLGQVSQNASPGLYFNVTANPPTAFDLLLPPNATESRNLQPNLSWQQTTEPFFDNYTILIDQHADLLSPDYIYRNSPITNNTKLVDFFLSANLLYYWKVVAYDLFGNSRNSTRTFTYITDTFAPNVTLISPPNSTFVSKAYTLFNYTPNDTNTIFACTLFGNFSGAFAPNNTNNTPAKFANNYFNLSLSEGRYLWNVRCNDSAGNNGWSPYNYTFVVDLTGPAVNLVFPTNNTTVNTSNTINFTANSTDFWANTSNCSLFIDGLYQQTKPAADGVNVTFTDFLNNGNHTWSVSCLDVNGNNGTSKVYNLSVLVIDSSPPLISLNYPTPNIFIANENVTFNYTPEDGTGVQNCTIYIDGVRNQTNFTIANQNPNYFNITRVQDGLHNWSIGCYDNTTSYNYAKTSDQNFTVDTSKPTVTLNEPGNNSYSISNILFNYTPNDANLANCTLYTNSTGAFSPSSVNLTPANNQPNYFSTSLSDGSYLWNVLCYDKSGKGDFSPRNYTLKVDTTPPQFSSEANSPISPATYSTTSRYQFNMTWTDNFNVSQVIFENNFNGTMANFTVNTSGSNKFIVNYSNITAGTYAYAWYATDSNNNQNNTSPYTYQVDKAASSINLTLNGTERNLNINEKTYANITTEMIQPISGTIELYNSGTLINNATSRATNITLFQNPGVYNITAIFQGDENYTSGSITRYVIVNDTTSPAIYLIQPPNNTNIASGLTSLTYNVTDMSSILNCSLYYDGAFNQSAPNVPRGVPQAFTVNVTNGNHSWYVRCVDNFTNVNTTHRYNFTAVPSISTVVNVYPIKPQYQMGEPANIMANTTDSFGNSVNATTTIDLIKGNTTIAWWNSSWKYRQPILISQTIPRDRLVAVEVNVTNLYGMITNCTELRLVSNNLGTFNVEPFEMLVANNTVFCTIRFNVNLPSSAVNYSAYHVYYGNAQASNNSTSLPVAGIRVQRSNVTGTGAQLLSNINDVDPSKSILLFTSRAGSSAPNAWEYTGDIPSSGQLTFDKYLAGTSGTVEWQVIEGSDITAQRNTVNFAAAAAETNVTIAPIDLGSSFIIIRGRANSATNADATSGFFHARFYNSTLITIRRESTTVAAIADWQVITWTGANVQNGTLSFATATSSAEIASVNTSRTVVFFGSSVSGSTLQSTNLIFANITNSTNISFSRTTGTGTAYVDYFVVELPPEFTNQTGVVSLTGTTNVPVSSVREDMSFHTQSWRSSNANSAYLNAQATASLVNETTLSLIKQSATGTNTLIWSLLEQEGATTSTAVQEQLVASYTNDTGSLGMMQISWDTHNMTSSYYSLTATAIRAGYTNANNYSNFNVTPDTAAPNVTLLAPPNITGLGAGYFQFNYTPFDYNLKNCTLYVGIAGAFLPNITNQSPANNQTNTFSNLYFHAGLYPWNVQCTDTQGNKGFAPSNFTLNVSGPDMLVTRNDIWFSNSTPMEFQNVTIYVNITNQGMSNANESFFVEIYRGAINTSGTLIANLSVVNLSIGEIVTLNTSALSVPGPNQILVNLDSTNRINESDESNNMANSTFNVLLYQYYHGNVTQRVILASSDSSSLYDFRNSTTLFGNVYFANSKSSFSFTDLQALTRNTLGGAINNDLTDADTNLNATGFNDSIKQVWGRGTDTPIQTQTFNISKHLVNFVPVVNSTITNSFITGILWDTADDTGNLQYDAADKEDMVFITNINVSKAGAYGTYDYEIKVPATLKDYRPNSGNLIFYVEIS